MKELIPHKSLSIYPNAKVPSSLNPRQTIKENFEIDLPIHGGWGYTKDDCVVIDKNDKSVRRSVSFDAIDVEKIFFEKRLFEELIVLQPAENCYSGIEWNVLKQELKRDGDNWYDQLIFEVTAFRSHDWLELKREYEGTNGVGSPRFDEVTHEQKRNELIIRFVSECWFEITSFFGVDINSGAKARKLKRH